MKRLARQPHATQPQYPQPSRRKIGFDLQKSIFAVALPSVRPPPVAESRCALRPMGALPQIDPRAGAAYTLPMSPTPTSYSPSVLSPYRPLLLWILIAAAILGTPRAARAQGAFVFDERLFNTTDTPLFSQIPFTAGSVPWIPTVLGGNLWVANDEFRRYQVSGPSSETATLTTIGFAPFTSGSWVFRATIEGTNAFLSAPTNYALLSLQGNLGSYGCRLLVNRTDGNRDLIFGEGPTFNTLFNQDVFTANTLPNRKLRLTLVNRNAGLFAFVDDLMPGATPINMMFSSTPTVGTIPSDTWTTASVTLGAKYSGSVDDVQLYNVAPYIESFNAATTVNPAPAPSAFDNAWSVLDSNNPTPWRINMQKLEWQGGGTTDPAIQSESPETDFSSDSWQFHATLKFLSAVNTSANRITIEIVPASGPALGVIIPKSANLGRRLMAYSGTESNVVASSSDGTDLVASTTVEVLYRLTIEYNRGELDVRINDRSLTAGAATLGFGSQNWKRFVVRGGQAHAFAVDSVLFHDAGAGWLAAPPDWASYE